MNSTIMGGLDVVFQDLIGPDKQGGSLFSKMPEDIWILSAVENGTNLIRRKVKRIMIEEIEAVIETQKALRL